jgi:geranylgeranyl diphosphate synthase, type II
MITTSSLETQLELIEKKLEELITPSTGPYNVIFEAAKYSLLSNGKRIRPLLTIAAAEAFYAPLENALTPACAIELIHTYSLIHDDLPCMDDDDLRRGKPTLHRVYPEAQAVLAGDLLLTLAFETVSHCSHLTAKQIVEITKVLARKGGGHGMVGGQSLDILSEGKDLSWDELKHIHLGKTAALISASLEIGGIVASVSEEIRKNLSTLGEKIGLSFQIIDDILDIEGNANLIGKPLLSDIENNKSTSVSILGLDKAKLFAAELLNSALDQCQTMGIDNSNLANMLPKLIYRSF